MRDEPPPVDAALVGTSSDHSGGSRGASSTTTSTWSGSAAKCFSRAARTPWTRTSNCSRGVRWDGTLLGDSGPGSAMGPRAPRPRRSRIRPGRGPLTTPPRWAMPLRLAPGPCMSAPGSMPVSLTRSAEGDGYARPVGASRRCTRSACSQPAVATLTYVYADQTAVLGPLATLAEPHTYDLCADHSQRMSAPRGWNVLRLAPDPATIEPTHDDLLALADAVREAARPAPAPVPLHSTDDPSRGTKRGHLRVLTSTD